MLRARGAGFGAAISVGISCFLFFMCSFVAEATRPHRDVWQPLSDNCTTNGILVKAWAPDMTRRVTQGAKVRVEIKATRYALTNATLILKISPEGAAQYKRFNMRPPFLGSSQRRTQQQWPSILNLNHLTWSGLDVREGKTQRFKVVFDLTGCAVGRTVSVWTSLIYEGPLGDTCAVASYPVNVSQHWMSHFSRAGGPGGSGDAVF